MMVALYKTYTEAGARTKFEIFADRIEITSYGTLIDVLDKEDFFAGTSVPRNRELMRVCQDLELVGQLGSGIPRILQSYERECFVFLNKLHGWFFLLQSQ